MFGKTFGERNPRPSGRMRGLQLILVGLVLATGILVAAAGGCTFTDDGAAWSGLVPGLGASDQNRRLTPSEGAEHLLPAVQTPGLETPGRNLLRPGSRPRMIELYSTEGQGTPRRTARVREPGLTELLCCYLSESKPTSPPDRWPWERYQLVVSYGDTGPGGRPDRQDRYEYLFKFFVPHDPGFVKAGEQWYQVPGKFNELLWSLTEYRQATTVVSKDDTDFLKRYGWTVLFKINGFQVTLPREWSHRAGEYPEVLYWAYNNELSKDVGLNLRPFAGYEVQVALYKVEEPLPEFMRPRREAGRAVVVKKDERIIGAWLDAGRHHAFACSLRGRRFEEITGDTWDRWIAGIIDYDDPIERRVTEAANSGPEGLLRLYFDAVDSGDFLLAHACETRRKLVSYLFMNMDNNRLYNPSYAADGKSDGLSNIAGARLVSVKVSEPKSGYPPGSVLCTAVLDLKVKRPVTYDSGRHTRFVIVRKETERTGWRIESVGTGP